MTIDLASAAAPLILAVGAAIVPPTALGVLATASVAWWLVGDDASAFCTDFCSYAVDRQAWLLQGLVLVGTAAVVGLSVRTVAPAVVPEFYALLLASAAGGLLVPAAGDLATLVIAVETLSLPAYALIALGRDDPRAGEAALKAFLVSVAASALTLYGVALLYAATGTIVLAELPDALADADPSLAAAGSVLVLLAFAFKATAVPLHGWAPDAYAGATPAVAGYLAVVSKTAGIAGILLLVRALAPTVDAWGLALTVAAVASLFVGALLALRQTDALRLLGWSSVMQAGFLLAPVAALLWEPERFADAAAASLAYLVTYAAMTMALVAVVAWLWHGGPVTLDRISGLFARSRVAAVVLAIALVCLAGLPPAMLGLFAKVRVIAEPVGVGAVVLAVALAFGVLVGAAVYLRWLVPLLRPAGETRSFADRPALAVGVVAAAVVVVGSAAPNLILGLL
jgi:NADH-quinone oxidoreductase subunit N